MLALAFHTPARIQTGCRFHSHQGHRGLYRCTQRSHHRFASLATTFTEAVSKGYVKDFGRVLKLNPDLSFGENQTVTVSEIWKPALEVVTATILESIGNAVLAIHVRGSVASGNYFEDGRSDLDLVVIMREHASIQRQRSLRDKIRAQMKSLSEFPPLQVDLRCIKSSHVSRSMSIVLRHYSAVIYGSREPAAPIKLDNSRTFTLAMNIKDSERVCLSAFEIEERASSFELKLYAIQWLCKKCLRALTELALTRTKKYARELVPCFGICSQAYPEYSDALLTGLQVACAHKSSGYAGLNQPDLLRIGLETAQDLVELVEDVFLKNTYGANSESLEYAITKQSISTLSPSLLQLTSQVVEGSLAGLSSWQYSFVNPDGAFSRHSLPRIEIRPGGGVEERPVHSFAENKKRSRLADVLVECTTPFVVRQITDGVDTLSILGKLMQTHLTVACRLSPSNVVTFCRSEHSWITERLWSSPSAIRYLRTPEAVHRLQEKCSLPPLVYKQSQRETLYIQTTTFRSEQLFDFRREKGAKIAQSERIWISAHGTVSSLHYDASYSVLVQRSGKKRMIFFSPECLGELGIYPLGHPLHRRARVNLCRQNSQKFQKFWNSFASSGLEVVLNPGDLVVFPPFWSHYTESLAGKNELSVSHTLRYITSS
ncbi:Hypoxia-inducible factor 1-alpha inhibitor [Gracilariopsis chorda]|uniref:Hypoxia-inducible factor 1-alpha inhibitor n=1 Tax=Gracilariopsis chorda TaxID=448386 RepID=A0A2V3J6L9_9FLOR|nr:Hypoxia-inducible factor 1-alpha inhibitor [Gracilariopsis chorda]|eukprot:PXF50071.1 Hypoxia-inducible factor 1-alpha inhibitor [Gracilariopsis chorda]